MSSVRPLNSFATRVAGAMSGPEAARRQSALAEIRALIAQDTLVALTLVPEPENPYDGDAIRVEALLPIAGAVQLGYIKNSNGFCTYCHKPFERFPTKGCSGCRRPDGLRRDGAATRISTALRTEPGLAVHAELLEVTGGTPEKECFGCNIRIRPVYPQATGRLALACDPGGPALPDPGGNA